MGSPETVPGKTGIITAHHGLQVTINVGDQIVRVKPPRREQWVVGDIIRFADGKPETIEPRKTELARIASNGAKQVLAANLDQLAIVTACGEAFKPGLIDRFIVASGAAGITPIVILNKTDLPGSGQYINATKKYAGIGLKLFHISAKSGEGFDTFRESLTGVTSALVGHSGVGKTSILNRLIPGLNKATADIHEKTGLGRHKTSVSMLFELNGGGAIIDSPGIRIFAPSGIEPEQVAVHFPGFAEWIGGCKFRNCLHITEPDCVIKKALDEKNILIDTYDSYVRMVTSVKETGPERR